MPIGRCLRQKKYSVIVAISNQGIVHYKVLERNCNTLEFLEFCKELNVPYGTKIVMDNIGFHKNRDVQSHLQTKGIETFFIPPYSPKTNPIEMLFGVIKSRYRKVCYSSCTNIQYKDLFTSIIESFRNTDLSSYYDHVATFLNETTFRLLNDPNFHFRGYD